MALLSRLEDMCLAGCGVGSSLENSCVGAINAVQKGQSGKPSERPRWTERWRMFAISPWTYTKEAVRSLAHIMRSKKSTQFRCPTSVTLMCMPRKRGFIAKALRQARLPRKDAISTGRGGGAV